VFIEIEVEKYAFPQIFGIFSNEFSITMIKPNHAEETTYTLLSVKIRVTYPKV